MSGTDNLKPVRTKEEARERGRNGGIASGESRRRKKTMKQAAKMLLDMQIPDIGGKELKAKLKMLGVSEDDTTYQTAVMVGVLQQAMKGNTKAAAFLRDTAGENPQLEMRKKELKQRRKEFDYKVQTEEELKQKEEQTDTLADAIVRAYENRMKEDGTDDA